MGWHPLVSVTATAFSFETMAVFVCNAWLLSVCVCVSISSPSSTIFSPSFCTVSWSNQAMIKTNFTEKLTQCLKTALSPHVKYRSGSHRHFLFSLVALAFFCFYVCNITVMAAERKQSYWGTEQLDEDVHLTTDLIKWLLNLKEKKKRLCSKETPGYTNVWRNIRTMYFWFSSASDQVI